MKRLERRAPNLSRSALATDFDRSHVAVREIHRQMRWKENHSISKGRLRRTMRWTLKPEILP